MTIGVVRSEIMQKKVILEVFQVGSYLEKPGRQNL